MQYISCDCKKFSTIALKKEMYYYAIKNYIFTNIIKNHFRFINFLKLLYFNNNTPHSIFFLSFTWITLYDWNFCYLLYVHQKVIKQLATSLYSVNQFKECFSNGSFLYALIIVHHLEITLLKIFVNVFLKARPGKNIFMESLLTCVYFFRPLSEFIINGEKTQ